MDSLQKLIATGRYDTDKEGVGPQFHSYCRNFYDLNMRAYRDLPISLLEIGVFRGGSMKLWRDYFTNPAELVGIDIDLSAVPDDIRKDPKIRLIKQNAYSEETAKSLGSFDIIIDDGPHTFDSLVSLITLYAPKIKYGGWMVIEDIRYTNWNRKLQAITDKVGSFTCQFLDMRDHNNRPDDMLFCLAPAVFQNAR